MDIEGGLLRRMVDKISAMLAYWDTTQRCRFANRAYEWWFGVSSEALIGTHLSQLLGPLYQLNLPYIEGALRGELQEFEREIPDPAGGPPRYSLASYIPDIVDGVVCGFVVLVTDISAIKRAELALKESETRCSRIISTAADAIISVDQDQRITIFNDGAEKIFGYTRAEIMGGQLGMLVPARLREGHARHVAAVVAGHDTSRPMGERATTILGLRKNGEEFPAEAAISKLELGGKALLTVALRDITERMQLEMERSVLAEAGAVLPSSLSYQQTLQRIAQLIVRHAADLCIIDMLESDDTVHRLTVTHADPTKASVCEQLAGLSLERRHILAASALDTKQAQVFDDISPAFLEATAQDQVHLDLLRKLAPRSAVAVPLLSARGVQGALVLASSRPQRYGARDVSLVTELARRAALAIDNARLHEAEQRATRARDEALAIVAHDVRSPMNSILLAARLIERELPDDSDAKVTKSLQIIFRSVERANRLIEDLLDVTRIEAGALSVAREALPVRPLVDNVLSRQQVLASAASIGLRLELDAALPEIWCDHHRMLQVLDNLVGNALKFTPPGGQITVGAASRAGEVLFSVADTGPGISREHLPRIFERFWQVGRAERRGAGLGLPICKGIVEAHDGRIWVESTPGYGTTFFFTIPAATHPGASRRKAGPSGT